MQDRLSLRSRLNLMIVLTMLTIIGLGTLFAIHNARRSVREEIASTVSLTLQLVEAGRTESPNSGGSLSPWLLQVGKLEQIRHLRIQVRDANSAITEVTSGKSPRRIDVPGWFIWSVAPLPVAVETRISDENRGVLTVRIEANAEDEIAEAWNEARGFLALLLVLAGTVYAVVHITVGRAFRSVGVILEGLNNIEKGDYGKRLPDFPLPEFARVSGAFNHMASALERARDENRALTQQSLTIQEEERRHLAQELHDELGQSLTVIKVMAAALRNPGDRSQEAVNHIMAICDRLFGILRGMLRRLRPIVLDDLGLMASLEDLIENWRSRNPGVQLDFICEDRIDECADPVKIHIFRIVQECLSNVVKHAAARRVRVRLSLSETRSASGNWILLQIADDGCGFDPNQPRQGFGLLGIRERVESLRGRFELLASPGEGVSIKIRMPSGEKVP